MATRASGWSLFRRLWLQARPYGPHLAGLFFLGLLSSALRLLTPLPLKLAVDSVIGSEPVPGFLDPLLGGRGMRSSTALLIFAACLLVVITVLVYVADLANSILSTYIGEKLVLGFRAVLFRHAQRLSLSYHDSRGTTDSAYRIQYDAPAIQWIMAEGVIPLITAGFSVASMIYIIAQFQVQMAVVALAVVPVLFLLTHLFGERLRNQSEELREVESSTLSVVQEVLGAVRVVKAFGQEDREEKRFVGHSRKQLRARLRVLWMAGGLGILIGLTTAVGTAVILFLGVRQIQAGALTVGGLILILTYLAQLYAPLETISKKMADLQGSLASADRAFVLLDEGPDVTERPHAKAAARVRGAVSFEHVAFAYNDRHPVLHNVSFDVDAGMRVGIRGKTGAGKTTLVSLLTRFYDPSAGRILLDGSDLRDYRLADLRNQFALVLQEPVLFSTTIAENIMYACPDASESMIVAAAQAANAHEFITALPDGYETRVGERGMQLSGGERQRLALARAFLKDAPILILDEPTSSVDTKTESLIMEAMDRLMKGRTTFMIAHRLSTLEKCDVHLHLEQGHLLEITLPGKLQESMCSSLPG